MTMNASGKYREVSRLVPMAHAEVARAALPDLEDAT